MRQEEAVGGSEVPRMDTTDLELLIQRAVRNGQPVVKPQNGNGYKLAFLMLGTLTTICIAISGWALVTLIDVKDDVAILKCQVSSSCQHAVLAEEKHR